MKNNNLYLLLFLSLISYCFSNCKSSKTYPDISNDCVLLSISELNNLEEKADCYTVKGYIVKKQTCPPCPAGALCKPCPPDLIYISDLPNDNNKNLALKLIIDLKTNSQFQVGDYGFFSFKILDYNQKDKPLTHYFYNSELIGYTLEN